MTKMILKTNLIGLSIAALSGLASGSDRNDAHLMPFAATILMQDESDQSVDGNKDTPAPVAEKTDGDDNDIGWYLRIGGGVNFLQKADEKDSGGGSIKFKAGSDFTIAAGIPFSDNLSLEVMSGFTYNQVESYENITRSFTFDNNGYLVQVPIVASLEYAINITDSIHLGLNAGAGLQISHINSSYFTFGTIYGTAYSFRYQAGINLTFNLSSSITLGAYGRWAGTTEANFDKNTQYPNGESAIILKDLQNVAIGGVLTIGF